MTLFSHQKIFIIAEMANSHEGNILEAKKITESAAKAGADAVKFQKFTADELAEPEHENYNLYKKLEMNFNEWKELVIFAKSQNLKVFVDVFGVKSAKLISKLNIDGFKIHSADVSNPHVLKFLAKANKPLLISTGGCLLNEIDDALNILLKIPKEIILMHGFQGYPTRLEDLNLLRISELKQRSGLPVGLMDHVSGDSKMALITSLLGISLGATVIEKHITLDRSKKGLDYYSALNPIEFKELVSLIRITEKSLGTNNFNLTANELLYRLVHKKNAISKRFIKKGTKLHTEM
ncbi:MAG: N-acetylneuraminate synthase family protein, partial [Nitrososphaeraceae archaeon]